MIFKAITAIAISFVFFGFTNADVYMHNPRGSNDRNCERNVNRDNGNRLFNSQNNNKGGYACPRGVGDEKFQNEAGYSYFNGVDINSGNVVTFNQSKRMYYYSGSILPIEWTNQHGCGGNSKVTCEIVLQYACEDTLDPKVDDFWPWVTNKAEATSLFRGKQHFRDTTTTALGNIAAPRDGVPRDTQDAATDTIPDNEASAIPNTVETRRFGMQESYDYYQVCQRTERNKGLYTADQRVNRNDRRGTRQNPNGDRHGFECPEERDYYPYWAPSPWIDIAVLSDSAGDDVCYPYSSSCTHRCQYYMNNTMNFNKKGYCDVNHTSQAVATKINNQAWINSVWYNNEAACISHGFKWYEVSHSDNLQLAANNFVCAHTQFARVNQLGNAHNPDIISQNGIKGDIEKNVTSGVNANRFQWTIPNVPAAKAANPQSYFSPDMTSAYKSCILRIRYNISSADFQQWPVDAVSPGTAPMVDSRNNSKKLNDPNTPLTQDPYIYIGPGDTSQRADKFVSLAVNTNQYGRTFQDRSYVFSIRPLPLTSSEASNQQDTPTIDHTTMASNLAAGGKIYNVNVRGKRGNIVQVYPAVEYDFVPNQLILSQNDMVHFQWTGSDYNPRRGCNDGEGGPPDLNTYFTTANANDNSRADRSNVVFMNHMANNVPRDYQGYSHSADLPYAKKLNLSMQTVLAFAPCSNGVDFTSAAAVECYHSMTRLSYLNQQSDIGSLELRQGFPCLTETDLNALGNQGIAENHPLNCAKINAKPYPYYDGGIMTFKQKGYFPYYSSRNNNFSNRQNIGVICVGSTCKVNNATGVLQDSNPEVTGTEVVRSSSSTCYTTVDGQTGATANGATSCIVVNSAGEVITTVLTSETSATQNQDNDAYGDGNKKGCTVLSFLDGSSTVEQQLGLAFGLLGVGLFFSWLAYFLYNRYQAKKLADGKFRHSSGWQTEMAAQNKAAAGAKARPASQSFAMPVAGAAAAGAVFSMANPASKRSPSNSPRAGGSSFQPVAGTEIEVKTSQNRPANRSFKPKASDMI